MASVLRSLGRAATAVNQTVALATRSLNIQSAQSLTCNIQPCLTLRKPLSSPSCLRTTTRSSVFSTQLVLSPLLQVVCKLGPATCLVQTCSYHVKVALKKRCSGCYFVKRKGRMFVECKLKPHHKQMQVMGKRKTWKEDYSKGNIERAIYWKYNRDKGYYKLGDNEYSRHDWLKGRIGVTV